jgi:two-component system NarL family response regulator
MSDATPIRVLVAEDHLIARVGITTILNAQPDITVVAEAGNGREAIDLFLDLQPDLGLFDVRMPVLGGIEAVAAIRAEAPAARIICGSTYGGDQDVRRALEAGASAYLTKDVLQDDLLTAVHAVAGGQRYLPRELAAALDAQLQAPALSARELEVLELIVKGLANKQIAYVLNITEHTVKNHVKKILDKLGVDDRTQAATAAIQRGIVHLP